MSARPRSPCNLRTTGPEGWARAGLRHAARPRVAGAVRQVGRQRRTALRAAWQQMCFAEPTGLLARRAKPLEHAWVRIIAREAVGRARGPGRPTAVVGAHAPCG